MSKVVLLINSASGALIDVAGNVRENARYAKFVHRILSLDRNPVLDYGGNGGDRLEISKGGVAGEEIRLVAKNVVVTGDLKVGGKTIDELAAKGVESVLDRIRGAEGEIDVMVDSDGNGDPIVVISLSEAVSSKIEELEESVRRQGESSGSFISKTALAEALDGMSIEDEDDFDAVKAKFAALLARLNALAGFDGSSSSEGSESSGEG